MAVYVYCIRENYRYQSSITRREFENELGVVRYLVGYAGIEDKSGKDKHRNRRTINFC